MPMPRVVLLSSRLIYFQTNLEIILTFKLDYLSKLLVFYTLF